MAEVYIWNILFFGIGFGCHINLIDNVQFYSLCWIREKLSGWIFFQIFGKFLKKEELPDAEIVEMQWRTDKCTSQKGIVMEF